MSIGDDDFDNDSDYVLAIALPNLKQWPTSLEDKHGHFTERDARDASFVGLPVQIKHEDRPADYVGVIDAAGVARLDHYALIRMTPAVSPYALAATKHVANGHYPSVSVSHRFKEVRASADSQADNSRAPMTTIKEPFEVSLVERPWRKGADIRRVWPSSRSIDNYSLDTLRRLTERYYADELSSGALERVSDEWTPEQVSAYKKRFAAIVRHQRALVVRSLPLSRSNPSPQTSFSSRAMSKTTIRASEATAPQPSTTATATGTIAEQVGAPAASDAMQVDAAAATTQSAGANEVEQPLNADIPDMDLKDSHALAKRMIELERRNRELAERAASLSQYKVRAEQEEERKRADARAKAEAILESLLQYYHAKGYPKDVIESQRNALSAQIDSNPAATGALIEQQKEMLVRASEKEELANKLAAEAQARIDALEQERRFNELADERLSMRKLGPVYSAASSSLGAKRPASTSLASSMNKRFVVDAPASAPPPQQQSRTPSGMVLAAPPSAGASSGFGASSTNGFGASSANGFGASSINGFGASSTNGFGVSQQQQNFGASQFAMPPAVAVRASDELGAANNDVAWGVAARQRAVEALRAQGVTRPPTIDEIECGYYLRPTGEVRASADGAGHDTVVEPALMFGGAARRVLDMASYAPELFDKCLQHAHGKTFGALAEDTSSSPFATTWIN